ncbi:hypothetical protein LINPERHAP2_LOCUS30066 [Linum perenne]
MAGMLPGVECARRRRFHKSGGIRRPSFCLYTSNHEGSNTSVTSLRSIQSDIHEDEKLGGVVREAKERLNWRLRAQNKSCWSVIAGRRGIRGNLGLWMVVRLKHLENWVEEELQSHHHHHRRSGWWGN